MMFESMFAVLLVWSGVLLWFWRALYARWREPAFTRPIVIFESDDWGAGPAAQAPALREIALTLSQHTNSAGEHPVMTLGIVLAAPCGIARESADTTHLNLTLLTDDSQREILAAIRDGTGRQVFALQLHGLTHFNQTGLLDSSLTNPKLLAWLAAPESCWTELLPSELQSVWTDASRLPSADVSKADIEAIVQREGALWRELFQASPTVSVPTTFIWTEQVETAWAAIGVRVVITPGARYQGRGADGKPGRIDKRILNGERGAAGIWYVVRDLYFEPSFGHSIDTLVDEIKRRSRAFRPSLIEIHRLNFCGPHAHPEALIALSNAVQRIMAVTPQVRFMSTERMAEIIVARDPAWIATTPRARLRALLNRVREIPRFWRLARITGLFLPLWVFQRVVA